MDSLAHIWGFLPPDARRRIAAQEKEAVLRRVAKGGEAWDPAKTKFQKYLVLDGPTFQPKRLFDIAPVNIAHANPTAAQHVVSPAKTLAYRNTLLPVGHSLELWQGGKRGRVCFTTDVVIPTLVRGPASASGWREVWMSHTPAEILTQRQGIRLAKGKCVIGGLGLGYFLEAIAHKPSVTEIIVVELNVDLMNWYGHALVQRVAAETGKKIRVIVGDAMDELGKHGDNTRYLYDIWDSFPVDLYGEARKAVDAVKHFWGWGVLAESAWR